MKVASGDYVSFGARIAASDKPLMRKLILVNFSSVLCLFCINDIELLKLNEVEARVKEINWTMYLPQIVLLGIAFYLGIYMPEQLVNLITNTIIGLGQI